MIMQGASGSVSGASRHGDHGRVGHRLVPPGVATVRPGHGAPQPVAQPPHDQHPLHAGRHRDRLVRGALERHHRAAPVEPVGGDEQRRVAVGEAAGHGRRAVAREDRRVDGADAPDRQHRDDRLGHERQVDADPVAGRHAQAAEHPGRAIDLGLELRVGEAADLAVLALPGQRMAVGVAGRAGVHGGRGVVERAAAPPAGPLGTVREVQDRASGRRCQASARSSAAAPQNQAGIRGGTRLEGVQATARRWHAGIGRGGSPSAARGRGARRPRGRHGRRSASGRLRSRRHATGRAGPSWRLP